MSLSSTYISRKQLIADNLQSMGVVSADVNDGLTTLANKILDIEPSISGLELDTNVTCSCSESEVIVGGSVVFTAKLTASYDDTSIVDVDLSGVLTGATVGFYSGNTLLGTGVTDVNGVATFTHVFNTVGVFSVHSVFSGTENFDECVSSSVSVTVDFDLSVSADKDILSYADGDSAVITAVVSDGSGGVSGESLSYSIMHDSTVIDSGSVVTDSNGEASITYTATRIGDVSVTFSLRSLLQKTYELEDLLKYDTCQTDKTSSYTSPTVFRGSGTPLFSFENGYGYKLGKSTGLGDVWLPIYDITGLTSYKIEFDQYCNNNNNSSNNGILFYKDNNNYHEFFYAIQSSCNYFNLTNINGSINYTNPTASNISPNTWVHYEITVENGSIALKVTQNDTVLYQNTYTLAVNPVKVGVVTGWSTGHSYVKNIKVKAL